jgi:indole-3-glycerol phosphate synthase
MNFAPFFAAIVSSNRNGCLAVIPDIKCHSPKEGDLLLGRDPVEVAKNLVNCGAPALSVVTEAKNFCGSLDLLSSITNAVNVPVLRKDFITDKTMIKETAEHGATAVLLTCAFLKEDDLIPLYDTALALGVEPVVEVHNEEEMAMAKRIGARLIAINNRNILEFERDNGDSEHTISLLACVPSDAVLISASGISSRDEATILFKTGVHGILVGTALWLSKDMYKTYNSLRIERKEIL